MPIAPPRHRPVGWKSPQVQDRERGGSTARGYGYRWQQARLAFLAANPLCVECRAAGHVTTATVVDHIVPHRGDAGRMWDSTNWQSLCVEHHDRKTAMVDGGFVGRGLKR